MEKLRMLFDVKSTSSGLYAGLMLLDEEDNLEFYETYKAGEDSTNQYTNLLVGLNTILDKILDEELIEDGYDVEISHHNKVLYQWVTGGYNAKYGYYINQIKDKLDLLLKQLGDDCNLYYTMIPKKDNKVVNVLAKDIKNNKDLWEDEPKNHTTLIGDNKGFKKDTTKTKAKSGSNKRVNFKNEMKKRPSTANKGKVVDINFKRA